LQARAFGRRLVGVVEEVGAGRIQHLNGDLVVGERRVDVVGVSGQVDPERAALLALAGRVVARASVTAAGREPE
jgi:hypothetical protein